ncbi:TPA: helix-turn-helix transcriptional regulator, partial [Escherichia coli]|nr:helix-turn-helix transcriptional regulator [Escherichia coli]
MSKLTLGVSMLKTGGRMNACMNKTESSLVMAADKACAERIKQSILQNFTYDDIENETGISVSTLKRLASGDREPKLIEIRQIAKATGRNPVWLAFGNDAGYEIETVSADMKLVEPTARYEIKGATDSSADHEVKIRVIAAIKDMRLEDVVFIERMTELLNLQNTIQNISGRKMKPP